MAQQVPILMDQPIMLLPVIPPEQMMGVMVRLFMDTPAFGLPKLVMVPAIP